MTRIALFGCTGNIGQHLLHELAKRGSRDDKFLVFSRSPAEVVCEKANISQDDARFEIRNNHVTADILEGVSIACIIVPDTMVVGATNYCLPIVAALKGAEVPRVVKVGTGKPETYEYGRRHLQAEKAITEAGLALTNVNLGALNNNPMFDGPMPDDLPSIGGKVVNFIGDFGWPYTDLHDVGDVLAVLLLATNPADNDGKTFDIISQPHITARYIADAYSEVLGQKVQLVDAISKEDQHSVFVDIFGFPADYVDELIVPMHQDMLKGVYDYESCDFENLTGQKPRTFDDYVSMKKIST